jgi:hypothetical protein
MKTLLIAAASLATIAAPIAASAQPYGYGHDGRGAYQNSYRGGDYRGGWGRGSYGGYYGDRGYDRGGNAGAAVAAGLFGFVLGSALSNDRPYAERCDWETQAVRGPYGYVHYEQVQVCR